MVGFLFMVSFGCCGLVAVWVGLWFSGFGWRLWFVGFCLCGGWQVACFVRFLCVAAVCDVVVLV